MGKTNWSNIQIYLSLLGNRIYLGREQKDGTFIEDKSDDRTDEAVCAVYAHLKVKYDTDKRKDPLITCSQAIFETGETLTYRPAPKEGETDGSRS